jgi:hypothetical protein
LFIIARDPQQFRELYAEEIVTGLIKQGYFTKFNRPLESYQSPECYNGSYSNAANFLV